MGVFKGIIILQYKEWLNHRSIWNKMTNNQNKKANADTGKTHELKDALILKLVGCLVGWGSSKDNAREYRSMSTTPHPSPQCSCFSCATLQCMVYPPFNLEHCMPRLLEYVGKASSSQVDTPLFVCTFSPCQPLRLSAACACSSCVLSIVFHIATLAFSALKSTLLMIHGMSPSRWNESNEERTLHCFEDDWCVRVWASPEYDHVLPLSSLSAWHGWEKAEWKGKDTSNDTFNVFTFTWCSGSQLLTTGRVLSCSSTPSSPWRTSGWSHQ